MDKKERIAYLKDKLAKSYGYQTRVDIFKELEELLGIVWYDHEREYRYIVDGTKYIAS
jgi:hypothetical protein